MNLKDTIELISDDFGSTFSFISENHVVNLLDGDTEKEILEKLFKKHLGNKISLSFNKQNVMNGSYDVYDIYINY